mmetsp:Transcript_2302/g.9026  ORF Transcript_2302/g.9026 Transcript_2302/m.9026 type:complete len:241 (+) Transcript_2302:2512-3234(+)
MLLRENFELRQPRHRPILIVDDFAQHAHGGRPRHARQVHRRLGVSRPFQHPTRAISQRKHVSRSHERRRRRLIRSQRVDRHRSFARRYPRRARRQIHAHRKRRLHRILITLRIHHQRQIQRVRPRILKTHAHQPARVSNHERQRLRRHLIRRPNQVPLVLPVLVVQHDDEFPLRHVLERVRDGREPGRGRVGIIPGRRARSSRRAVSRRARARAPTRIATFGSSSSRRPRVRSRHARARG